MAHRGNAGNGVHGARFTSTSRFTSFTSRAPPEANGARARARVAVYSRMVRRIRGASVVHRKYIGGASQEVLQLLCLRVELGFLLYRAPLVEEVPYRAIPRERALSSIHPCQSWRVRCSLLLTLLLIILP